MANKSTQKQQKALVGNHSAPSSAPSTSLPRPLHAKAAFFLYDAPPSYKADFSEAITVNN
jgi:hypothetical protein